MADYDALTSHRVIFRANGIIGDTTGQFGDPDTRPDMFNVNMSATIRLYLADDPNGPPELRITEANPPRTLLLIPVTCRVENGVLRMPGAAEGEDGVEIVAKSAIMGLGDRVLAAEVTFGPASIGGNEYQYDPIRYEVPYVSFESYTPGVHQKVTFIGGPTGGNATLLYGVQPTGNIPWNISGAAMQTALRAIPAIGDNVDVTGPVAGPDGPEYDVVFTGPLANRALTLGATDNFTGGASPSVRVTDYYEPVTIDLTTVDDIGLPPSTPSNIVIRKIPTSLELNDDGDLQFLVGTEPFGPPVPFEITIIPDVDITNVTGVTAIGLAIAQAVDEAAVRGLLDVSTTAAMMTAIGSAVDDAVADINAELANKQPIDADLTAIAGLASAADRVPYATGAQAWALAPFTAAGRALVDDVDATAQRATLGATSVGHALFTAIDAAAARGAISAVDAAYVSAQINALVAGSPGLLDTLDELAAALGDDPNFAATMTTVLAGKQPLSTDLTAIAALVSAANKLPYSTGAGTWALTTLGSFGRSLIDDVDALTARATLGLVIGTNVQAYDADLDVWATKTAPAGTVLGTTDTQSVSGKRITRRVLVVTQAAAPVFNTDSADVISITGLAQAITSMTTNQTGTPVAGDQLEVQITDNGVAQAIAWGSKFEAAPLLALPTATIAGLMLVIRFVRNAVTSKWRIVTADVAAGGGGGAGSFSANVGDGVTTSWVVTHNLGTRNVTLSLKDAVTFEEVDADPWFATTVNTVTINFAVAPATNAYIVTIQGGATTTSVGSTSITDSTAIGRTLLTAANVAAEHTALNNFERIFVPPPTAGWSVTALGTTTVAADRDGRLFTATVDATNTLKAEYQALPGGGYTCTAHIETDSEMINYHVVGLWLKNSGGAAQIHYGLACNNGWFFRATKYTNANTYNSDYKTPALANLPYGPPKWLRIRDDNTNRFYEYSYNGVDWYTFTSTGRTDFITPNQIGWVVCGASTGAITSHARLRSWSLV